MLCWLCQLLGLRAEKSGRGDSGQGAEKLREPFHLGRDRMGGHERSGVRANWSDDDYFTY